ncbi:hypothetical protein G6F43_007474 [Rhizopus delemar]|nr:hypothetical protein G6F43_007474 [Rhizopus delemar]
MRSVLVIFGLLSAFMLVSSLPLDPSILEKRQLIGPDTILRNIPIAGSNISPLLPLIEISLVTGLVIKLFLHSAAANQASFLVKNAKNLSDMPDESVDDYVIAFGIRTRTHVDRIIEKSTEVCEICSFDIISALGQIIAGNHDSYQYLVESIRKSSPQEKFAQIIRDAGFKAVGKGYKGFTFGAVAIHNYYKI